MANNVIHDLICSMLAHQRLPTLCCRSQGHFIPKPNGDQRLIHALCPFGKDFMRCAKSTQTQLAKLQATVMEAIPDGGAKVRSYNKLP